MAVFVMTADDDVLYVFADEAAALAFEVAYEVTGRSADKLFFADDGSGLQHLKAGNGSGWFRPWASCNSCHLAQVLYRLKQIVDAGNTGLGSVEAIGLHVRRDL